jgi:hypothetical protein
MDLKFYNSGDFTARVATMPLFIILTLTSVVMLIGCGTLSNGRGWGQDAILNPGWTRIEEAAINAAISPETWVTVTAALVLQIDDMDKRISDWASENTPIFGAQNDADRWSDYLRNASGAAYLLTALAAPGGEDPFDWSANKLKGIAVGATAWGISSGMTEVLKNQSERNRPDQSNNRSFPSGHTSSAGSFTTLGQRNIPYLSLSPTYKSLSNIALYGIAAGTAWARVEAKQHYPSDALVGYAIGHFFSALINDAFLESDSKAGPSFAFMPSRKGMIVNMRWAY